MTVDPVALIKGAKRTAKVVPVCTRGDLVAEHEQLQVDLAAAERQRSGSLEGNAPALEIAARIVELEKEMAESVVDFRMEAMGRRRWDALVAQHAPREGNQRDAQAGYNVDEFVAAGLRLCVVDPVLDDETWEQFVNDDISDGQYEQFTEGFWEVNRKRVSVPFSRAASRIRAASASGSPQPEL